MAMVKHSRIGRPDIWEYGIYGALIYPFILVKSLASRVLGQRLGSRYRDDRRVRTGILDETSAATNCSLHWIFTER